MMKRLSVGLVALGLSLGIPGWARGAYVFTTLDVPGAISTAANGISNAGQIVGQYDAGGQTHGFLLNGSGYTTIDVPGATLTTANGINVPGQIVGSYRAAGEAA